MSEVANTILTVPLLICLIVGVYIGVSLMTKPIDSRYAEAQLLLDSITSCITEHQLDWQAIKENRTLFYQNCSLNEDITAKYLRVRICKNDISCINSQKPVFYEGSNIEECGFKAAKTNLDMPRCTTGVIKKGDDTYEIIVGSNHKVKRVLSS